MQVVLTVNAVITRNYALTVLHHHYTVITRNWARHCYTVITLHHYGRNYAVGKSVVGHTSTLYFYRRYTPCAIAAARALIPPGARLSPSMWPCAAAGCRPASRVHRHGTSGYRRATATAAADVCMLAAAAAAAVLLCCCAGRDILVWYSSYSSILFSIDSESIWRDNRLGPVL
eukprot:COSAG01_NODE_24_length_37608_cov_19.303154_29_plen_173_part_00